MALFATQTKSNNFMKFKNQPNWLNDDDDDVCVCVCVFAHLERFYLTQHETVRDGPLENLWGGGGELPKKYSRKRKLNN